MKKRVIISWSSGKDSTLTLERLMESNDYEVIGLYTTYVSDEVPFQATPLPVLDMQAELLGLPLIKIELPQSFPSNEVYQSSIINALKQSRLEIEAVAFGDMFCNGIEEYRRSFIEPQGWECVFPLLGESSQSLSEEIIERQIKTLVVTTDGHSLAPSYCGKWYNNNYLASLPSDIDPCGENGEFHTLVCETRSYSAKIELALTSQETGERFTHQRYTAKILPK
ncbi:ATPase [Vibrio sonorensis]|uniref:Dph6-related ATP pyrophosphatase n=1 Tax=Vibrio sonorensis TaxID=1004316 RepID=UPI0008DA0302|nr:ATPase [Vibrio sonorensis]